MANTNRTQEAITRKMQLANKGIAQVNEVAVAQEKWSQEKQQRRQAIRKYNAMAKDTAHSYEAQKTLLSVWATKVRKRTCN